MRVTQTGHFMQIKPLYLQGGQILFVRARLPTLGQAANHTGILKRPEGPEAASSILGWKMPRWDLHTGGQDPT